MNINKVYLLCLVSVLSSFRFVYGQSFGLGFSGYEVNQEKRTGLDLSPGKTLGFSNDFEISFDLTFRPNQKTYYGYIFRIINNDKTNIDLLYKDDLPTNKHFKLIVGNSYSGTTFEIPKYILTTQRSHFRLRFEPEHKKLIFYAGGLSFSQNISLHKKDFYKILFGANTYKTFKTFDVPQMIVSDIKIFDGGKLVHYWPLNEYKGNLARDMIKASDAMVINPFWIKAKHYDWELKKIIMLPGEATVAFDPEKETVFLTNENTVFTYKVDRDTLTAYHSTGRQFMMQGAQSIYIPYNKSLLDVSVDRKQVAVYNFDKQKWDKKLNDSLPYSAFYQHNKFFSPIDTTLYTIGGYGYYFFKNSVRRYHLNSKKWDTVKAAGDFLPPHYLAALGATLSGAYILGGYGSITGDQTINPRYFYSLCYYDVKSKAFKKIYDLKTPPQDYVFSNSMVINPVDSTFYTLLFNKDEYNSKLQMIHGSLTKPRFTSIGSAIPYTFKDISSFAELFYCPKNKRFIAVTLYRNDKKVTRANIYSIYSPPIALTDQPTLKAHTPVFWYSGAVIASVLYAFLLLYKKRNRIDIKLTGPTLPTQESNIPPSDYQSNEVKNSVFLFGDFQVFDADGHELTKCFTPLIRELFLITLIYSIRWDRGISSKKLEELLWSDKSIHNAHSNLAVNIGRLKNILEKIQGCSISKENGYWKIITDRTNVDYKTLLCIIHNKKEIDKQDIDHFIQIISRGFFLTDIEFEWLDSFKSEISNEVVNIFLKFTASVKIEDDPEFLIQLATHIFSFDGVNEEAMVIKCRALSYLGKHSLAKSTFEIFIREYETIYGETFDKSFHEIIDHTPRNAYLTGDKPAL